VLVDKLVLLEVEGEQVLAVELVSLGQQEHPGPQDQLVNQGRLEPLALLGLRVIQVLVGQQELQGALGLQDLPDLQAFQAQQVNQVLQGHRGHPDLKDQSVHPVQLVPMVLPELPVLLGPREVPEL